MGVALFKSYKENSRARIYLVTRNRSAQRLANVSELPPRQTGERLPGRDYLSASSKANSAPASPRSSRVTNNVGMACK